MSNTSVAKTPSEQTVAATSNPQYHVERADMKAIPGNVSAFSKTVPPPPGITPPPGFGVPIAQHVSTSIQFPPPTQGSYGQTTPNFPSQIQPQDPVHHTALGTHLSAARAQHSTAPPGIGQNVPIAGHSMNWLGDSDALRTANPFAGPPVGYLTGAFEMDTSNVDDASLLGAGLLDSLYGIDKGGNRTNNPFAANH